MTTNYIEIEVSIGQIQSLLLNFNVEVDSPDGWVTVTDFVDKGLELEYILELSDHSVRMSMQGKHLLETDTGWKYAEDLQGFYEDSTFNVLTKDGYKPAYVYSTGRVIPIVDITVDHENHRYFTEGISSHNSGGGKSLVMSHMAAGFLREGYNTLYISLEMSEEKIAERIDANLMGVDLDKIKLLGKDLFCTKIANIAAKTQGRLFVKEYPNGSAHTGHFRGLVEELKTKQNFKPDVILVDYLACCASARLKLGGSVNSYAFLKSISEELRALATELDLPIITAGQVNRGAYGSSDIDLSDTSESMGIIHTSDLVLGLVRTEELDSMNQLMITQLKNRYSDPASNKRFIVGLNRAQMKLSDIDGGGSFTPDATNKKYEPKPRQTVQDVPKNLSQGAISDMMDSLPITKPKSLNTQGFAF